MENPRPKIRTKHCNKNIKTARIEMIFQRYDAHAYRRICPGFSGVVLCAPCAVCLGLNCGLLRFATTRIKRTGNPLAFVYAFYVVTTE